MAQVYVKHDSFWSIQIHPASNHLVAVVSFNGQLGTRGRKYSKKFPSTQQATAWATVQISKRTNAGYQSQVQVAPLPSSQPQSPQQQQQSAHNRSSQLRRSGRKRSAPDKYLPGTVLPNSSIEWRTEASPQTLSPSPSPSRSRVMSSPTSAPTSPSPTKRRKTNHLIAPFETVELTMPSPPVQSTTSSSVLQENSGPSTVVRTISSTVSSPINTLPVLQIKPTPSTNVPLAVASKSLSPVSPQKASSSILRANEAPYTSVVTAPEPTTPSPVPPQNLPSSILQANGTSSRTVPTTPAPITSTSAQPQISSAPRIIPTAAALAPSASPSASPSPSPSPSPSLSPAPAPASTPAQALALALPSAQCLSILQDNETQSGTVAKTTAPTTQNKVSIGSSPPPPSTHISPITPSSPMRPSSIPTTPTSSIQPKKLTLPPSATPSIPTPTTPFLSTPPPQSLARTQLKTYPIPLMSLTPSSQASPSPKSPTPTPAQHQTQQQSPVLTSPSPPIPQLQTHSKPTTSIPESLPPRCSTNTKSPPTFPVSRLCWPRPVTDIHQVVLGLVDPASKIDGELYNQYEGSHAFEYKIKTYDAKLIRRHSTDTEEFIILQVIETNSNMILYERKGTTGEVGEISKEMFENDWRGKNRSTYKFRKLFESYCGRPWEPYQSERPICDRFQFIFNPRGRQQAILHNIQENVTNWQYQRQNQNDEETSQREWLDYPADTKILIEQLFWEYQHNPNLIRRVIKNENRVFMIDFERMVEITMACKSEKDSNSHDVSQEEDEERQIKRSSEETELEEGGRVPVDQFFDGRQYFKVYRDLDATLLKKGKDEHGKTCTIYKRMQLTRTFSRAAPLYIAFTRDGIIGKRNTMKIQKLGCSKKRNEVLDKFENIFKNVAGYDWWDRGEIDSPVPGKYKLMPRSEARHCM